MYGTNAPKHDWMDEVVFIFWGPAQKTILENVNLKDRVKALIVAMEKMQVWACKACSDGYGVSEKLGRTRSNSKICW